MNQPVHKFYKLTLSEMHGMNNFEMVDNWMIADFQGVPWFYAFLSCFIILASL